MNSRIILMSFVGLLASTMISGIDVQAKSKIKINKNKVGICVGEATKLKIKGTSKKIKWSSSKKKIATVDKQGKVYAKKKGVAVITAKVSGIKLKCRVTVKNKSKKSIVNRTAETYVDSSYQLKDSVKKWIYINTDMLESKGHSEIIARKCGKTEITYESINGKIYRYDIRVLKYDWIEWDDGAEDFIYVAVNDTSFDYMTDFRYIQYNKEEYTLSFDGFLPYAYKDNQLIKLPETVFDITKPGEYYARYKVTCLECGQSQYIARVIKVVDEETYKNIMKHYVE